MPKPCSIPFCSAKKHIKLSLFAYPVNNTDLWEKWKIQLKTNFPDINLEEIVKQKICHTHFENQYLTTHPKAGNRRLTKNAVPTIFKIWNNEETLKNTPSTKFEVTSKVAKYENSCRLCLEQIEDSSSKILKDSIIQEVELLTNTQLKTSISYPKSLCQECFKAVKKFIKFRSKIIQNQEILSREIGDVDIKQEVEDYPNEDFFASCSSIDSNVEEAEDHKDFIENIKQEVPEPEYDFDDTFDENCSASFKTESESESEDFTKTSRKARVPKKRIYKKEPCQICGKVVRSNYMKNHVASKHQSKDELKYVCDICGSRFFDRKKIKTHVKIHIKFKKFACDFEGCQKTFSTEKRKTMHINRIHTKLGNAVCEECGKAFSDPLYLRRHKVVAHIQERNFICDFVGCNKSFVIKEDLQVHKANTHSGPQTCQQCGKVCPSQASLNQHKKKHDGKIFYCDYMEGGIRCEKFYYVKSELKQHLKTHRFASYRCPICSDEFKYSRPLEYHYLSTHTTFQMNCLIEGCNFISVRKDTMRKHLKKSHAHHEPEILKKAMYTLKNFRILELDALKNNKSFVHSNNFNIQ